VAAWGLKQLTEARDLPHDFFLPWQTAYHCLLGNLDAKWRGELYSNQTELQADCLTGVWARSAFDRNMLHEGDIDEVLLLAENIADAPGTSPDHPEAHGTAEQRQVWFMAGYNTGDPSHCQIY
jgi:predicted metalloprotease